MSKRRILSTVFCAAFLVGGAGAALAGEVTGNDKSLHIDGGGLHGKSNCAYSGLEDNASGGPGVVQNFGNWEFGGGGVKQGNNPSEVDGPAAPGTRGENGCNPSDPQNPD